MNDKTLDVDDEELIADRQRYARCLQYVREHAAGPIEGLYAQDGVARRIWRENATLAAIPPAVVLQVLWPQVAEGVSSFSDYQSGLVARTRRTTFAMYAIIFGDVDTANDVCRRILHIHERVRGVISVQTSARLAGRRYRANEPESLQWVHASLVYTAMEVYGALMGPLERHERARFYEEAKLGAAAMSIWPDDMPRDIEAFDEYFQRVVDEKLELGETARNIIHHLLAPVQYRPVARMSVGFLPERWRGAVGLPWDESARREHELGVRLLRQSQYLPSQVRYAPAYHQTQVRMARATGQKLTMQQRIVNVLDQKGWMLGGLAPAEKVMRRN